MLYLPDYDVSIAVMVNRCFSGCDTRIARDLSRITALSLTPKAYLDLLWSPLGFLAGLWIVSGGGAAIYGFRKDKPLILVVFGGLALVAGWFSIDKWSPLDLLLFTVGGVVGALGLALSLRQLRRNPRATILAVASLLLEPVRAHAQLPVVPENIKTTVRQRVDYGYCPGIVVGLMNTSGCTYFSYGNDDLDGGPAVGESTLFEIGSIGKVFTTTLLADMAQRREVELTDTIQSYLPQGITAPRWDPIGRASGPA
jgi:hypothetical protein